MELLQKIEGHPNGWPSLFKSLARICASWRGDVVVDDSDSSESRITLS
jgi:hypothetical protein